MGLRGGSLITFDISITAPRPAGTGKTLTVASSKGNKSTDVQINGLPVIMAANGTIKPGS